jgi:trimeric autotransporter adhesin
MQRARYLTIIRGGALSTIYQQATKGTGPRIASILFAAATLAGAQPLYTISTVAGGVPPPTPISAVASSIGGVPGVAVDGSGNVYFTSQLHCVFKVSGGTLTRLAGTCRPGFSGDGGTATSAQLNGPAGIAVDASGNVYIADRFNNRIRKVTTGGTILTVAGNGTAGTAGDGGQATSASLNAPQGIAVDALSNLYIADTANHLVRKVTAAGVISTIAGTMIGGTGQPGFSGDGGTATSAQLNTPTGVSVDTSGNVYIADQGNNRVRKISGTTITTFAGNGVLGFSGDGGAATSANLHGPTSVAVDGSGNVYIADTFNNEIRKVSGGTISTFAGTLAASYSGDGGAATSAAVNAPMGIAVDATGKVYIADTANNRVRQVSGGVITTLAGNGLAGFSGDSASAATALLAQPSGVAVDSSGNLYVADTANHRVRKITTGGIISTVAGNGTPGFSGDGGSAVSAQLYLPAGVAVDANGTLYIADTGNQRVRQVTAGGVISTIAGTGTGGFSGDGAAATAAKLNNPNSVAVDTGGNLYICDSSNNLIRKVSAGVITTVAGDGTLLTGFSGDGGSATSARLFFPAAVAVDSSGNFYIADQFNNRIRKVSGGVINTVAGNGVVGFSGDGGAATSAQLNLPAGVAVDGSGNLFISDSTNNRIRYVAGGTIFTIAGTGVAGYNGEGIATSAQLFHPTGIAVDSTGKVSFSETGANDVRRLTPGAAVPVLSIVKSHTGSFFLGQNGAVYTLTVSNETGAQPTSGTVTVTENIPAGLTLVSMAGTGWTCPGGGSTCTRSDVLAAGSSYLPITVTVNVSAGAASQLTNQATASGGGSATATANDATNVSSGCAVAVSPLTPGVASGASTLALTLSGGACGWTASSNAPWLTPAATSGTGTSLNITVAANNTGGQRSGTLTVAGQTVTVTQAFSSLNQAPSLVSLNPFQGTGLNADLTLVYSDVNGWASIASAEFIINPRWEPSQRGGGCYIKYTPATGLFTLIADNGTSVAGTTVPGSAVNIANSQCTLNAAASFATGSGNTLTLAVSLTFSPAFSGQKHIWMQASDYNNLSSNWLVYGVWFPTQTTFSTGPWYRIYDPFSKTYLYSADANEYSFLGSQGFQQQGISGLIMTGPGSIAGVSNLAFYRVFVNSTSSHFWTSDRNEFLTLINTQQAYVGEGVATFIMPYLNAQGQISPQVTNTIPFYRAAFQGANLHFWTSDPNEYFGTNGQHLPAGYFGEGIASYIFPASGAQLSNSTLSPAAAVDGAADGLSIVNGASYVRNGTVAPGQVLTVFGHNGGRVLLNGVPAQVVGTQENALRILVPNDLGDASEVTVQVEHRGGRRGAAPVTLSVAAADPAIFVNSPFGRGNAQARNEDGASNDPQHAAARGSVVTLYTTGIGSGPVEAHIGGFPAEVLSTNVSATRPGVIEVHVRVPNTVEPASFQPVVLRTGNLFSQPGVGLAIR